MLLSDNERRYTVYWPGAQYKFKMVVSKANQNKPQAVHFLQPLQHLEKIVKLKKSASSF